MLYFVVVPASLNNRNAALLFGEGPPAEARR